MSVRVKGWTGVAFYDPSPSTEKGKLRVQMVGDDRVFEVDEDDVTPLQEDEYCGSCGQIGCCHG